MSKRRFEIEKEELEKYFAKKYMDIEQNMNIILLMWIN